MTRRAFNQLPPFAEAQRQVPSYAADRAAVDGMPFFLRLADRFVDMLHLTYTRVFRRSERPSSSDPPPLPLFPDAHFAAGDGLETIAALNRTLAIQPHNCLAWFQLGMLHLQREEVADAVVAFESAKRVGFDTFELHFYLAEALSKLDRHEDAVAELYKAVEKQPASAEPAYRLGLSLFELERYEEAAAAFKIAISQSSKTGRYYQGLGLTLDRLDQRDEAIKCFAQAANLDRRA